MKEETCAKDYEKEIMEVSNQIALKTATKSLRKGKGRVRDSIVFGKMVWGEAFSYISPLQTIIIFSALITPAVITFNKALYEFQSFFNISPPFQFPINLISIFAAIAIVVIFIFGIVSVRNVGTYLTTNEYAAKMNPGTRLIWKKNEEILKRLESIEKKLESLK